MYYNEYEIRVFGLKHAGQHAVINWIATLFREPVYFFNNCGWGGDPHRTGRTRGTRKDTPIENIFVSVPRLKRVEEEEVEKIRRTPKKCLIYSYENSYMDRINRKKRPATLEGSVGKSLKVFDVLILRDIFNLTAATLKYKGRFFREKDKAGEDKYLAMFDYRNYERRKNIRSLFTLAALEFLDRSSHMREKKICISFNDWFLSKGYRECIAKMFGLPNNEMSLGVMAAVGGRGSSFDKIEEYGGRAREMNILERWKHFEGNKIYWDILREWREAVDLSNEIFGEIPGTMEYLDGKC